MFQNAESLIVEAYSVYSPAHEKHMRHSCVPRCSHARSDAKSVARISNWTRGSNYIGYNFRDGCVLMCNEDSMQFEYATCLQFFCLYWLRKKLRLMDLADLRAKRRALGKTAYVQRVKGVIRSQKAQAVAKKCAAKFRKTCKQVFDRGGAAADN